MRTCLPRGFAFAAVVVAVFLSAPAVRAQVDFVAIRDSMQRSRPAVAPAIGDFDEDGHVDVAVADGSDVRILRNDGLDRIVARELLALAHPVTLVAALDLDQDGHLDLVLGADDPASFDDPVEIRRGRGDGTFDSPVMLFAGNEPTFAKAVDIDGDGDLDLVVASDHRVSVHRAAGGVFLPREIYATGRGTRQVDVSDVTADGFADLLVSSFTSFEVRMGNSAGEFSPATDDVVLPAGTDVRSTRLGDVDGNGTTDLVHALPMGEVGVQANDGAAIFADPSYTPGFARRDLALASMDGDGFVDAIGLLPGTVQVWRGADGMPDFELSTSTILGEGRRLAVGDFDGNGTNDVVVTRERIPSDRGVTLLLNDGSGALTATAHVSLGFAPSSIAVGDFTEDGNLDALAVDADGLHHLAGDGAGSLAPAVPVLLESLLGDFVVGDFLEDGHLDVAILHRSAGVRILAGGGDGSFVEVASLPGPLFFGGTIATADFDEDGHLDLAWEDATLRMSFGDGTGGFSTPVVHPLSADTRSVVAGDVNDDGHVDLVVGRESSDAGHQILFGDGTGAFGRPPGVVTWEDSGGSGFALADIDDDGVCDVLLTAQGTRLLRGIPSGGFEDPVSLPIPSVPSTPVLEDVDDDGSPDFVFSGYAADDQAVAIVALRPTGGGSPIVSTYEVDVAGSMRPAVADLTNDGKLDIVLDGGPSGPSILPGAGGGGFRVGSSIAFTADVKDIATGDFDGDGNLDLVFTAEPVVFALMVMLGDGAGGFGSVIPVTGAVSPEFLAVGDFNEDSLPDVAVTAAGSLLVYTSDGDGSLTRVISRSLSSEARHIATGDLDGDGHLDLAISVDDDIIEFYFGLGNGAFLAGIPFTLAFEPHAFVIGEFVDFGGSGQLDLCVIDPGAIGVTLLRNNGNRVFTRAASFPLLESESDTLVTADLDHDGDLDLALRDGSRIRLRFGDGQGTFPDESYLETAGMLAGVGIGDFDGDDELDLLAVGDDSRFDILLGEGNTLFDVRLSFAGMSRRQTGPHAIGDFNGDGFDDVVLASNGDLAVHLNRNDRAIRCRAGVVDTASHGSPVDVLHVNGSTGTTTTRDLAADSLDPLQIRLDRAPAPAVGSRYYSAIWDGRPNQVTAAPLPRQIGFACFQPLVALPGFVPPLYVANTIKPNDPRLLPSAPEATGSSLPGVVLDIPGSTFAPGDVVTVQALIGDGNGPSPKKVSTTNAVVVTFD